MKKAILVLGSLFYLAGSILAGSGDIFSIDREVISNELSGLAELEAHVKATNSTYSELTASNSPLVSNLTKSNSFANVAVLADPPLGISSFLWGFCVGFPGVAIVYFVTEDRDQTILSLWGCVANTVMWGAVYAVWVLVLAANANV